MVKNWSVKRIAIDYRYFKMAGGGEKHGAKHDKSIRRVLSPGARSSVLEKFLRSNWWGADAGNCFQVIKLAELLPLKVFSDPRRISKSFTCGEKFPGRSWSGSAAREF